MRNDFRILRVKDDPIAATAVPTQTGQVRIFQVADSNGSSPYIGTYEYPLHAYRFQVPCVNAGIDLQGVFINGHFKFSAGVTAGDRLCMNSYVQVKWDDLAGHEDSEGDTLIGTITSKTTYCEAAPSFAFYDTVPIIAGGILLPGEARDLNIDLYVYDTGSDSTVSLDEVGGFIQGFVKQGIQPPWPESYWVTDNGEAEGDWVTGHYDAGDANHSTMFQKYWG